MRREPLDRTAGVCLGLIVLLAGFAPTAPAVDAWWLDAAARRQHIEASPAAAALEIDSLLAFAADAAEFRRALPDITADYLELAGDSLLVRDARFCASLAPKTRAAWWRGVQHDAGGMRLRESGEALAAAARFEQAAQAYRDVGDQRRLAVVLGSLGVALFATADWDATQNAYERALEARLALGDPVLIGRTQNALGSVTMRRNDLVAAESWYEQARRTREQIGDPIDLGTTLSYLGNVRYLRGDLAGARRDYLEALRTLGDDAPPRALHPARMGLANVHTGLGEYEEAIAIYRAQLDLGRSSGDAEMIQQNQRNLADALRETGDMNGALRELQEVVALQESLGATFELAATFNVLGSVYEQLGDLNQALATYTRAKDQAIAANNEFDVVNAMRNIGMAYTDLGLHARALESYAEALAFCRDRSDSLGMSSTLMRRGETLRGLGDADSALASFRLALSIDQRANARTRYAGLHGAIANALTELGRNDEAVQEYRQALAWARELLQGHELWTSTMGLADAFEQAGQLDSARVYNQQAIETLEHVRGKQLDADLGSRFSASSALAYEAQVAVLAKLHARHPGAGHDEAAFRIAERGRARSFVEQLQAGHVDVDCHLDSALATDLHDLDRRLTSVQYQLRLAAEHGAGNDSLAVLQRQRSDIEAERRTLRQRARLQDPRLAALVSVETSGYAHVRQTLLHDRNALLLEYSLGDSVSFVWVITGRDAAMHALPGRGTIETAVRRLRSALTDPAAANDAIFLETAARLGDMLLGPARNKVDRARRVTIVPDGVLHFLPFEVLLAKAVPAPPSDVHARGAFFTGLKYILDDADVRYGPSATTLVLMARQDPVKPDRDLLAVGDPQFTASATTTSAERGQHTTLAALPFSRDEVTAIGSLFPEGRRTLLLGPAAAEATLAQPGAMQAYRIVHFATHGLVDERRPERSSLALAFPTDPSHDGFLEAAEIYEMRLRAEIVVLSACETGLGRMLRGEGVLGLPRAFLYAGASSVLVSLWSVADRSTAELMRAFYGSHVEKRQPFGQALRSAKAKLRRNPEFAHPFHWSAFVLMGAGAS